MTVVKIKLIDCPACNNQVSVQAKSCPKCGHPVSSEVIAEATPYVSHLARRIPKARNSEGTLPRYKTKNKVSEKAKDCPKDENTVKDDTIMGFPVWFFVTMIVVIILMQIGAFPPFLQFVIGAVALFMSINFQKKNKANKKK